MSGGPTVQDLAAGAQNGIAMLGADRDHRLRIGGCVAGLTPHDVDHALRVANGVGERVRVRQGFGVLDRPVGDVGRLIDDSQVARAPS